MAKNSAVIILRWGLAFVFFYAAISSLINPNNWIGYLPSFVEYFISPRLFLTLFSFYEMALAVMLFVGKELKIISILSAASLAGVTAFNLSQLEVVIRDVGLVFMALALYELVKKDKSGNSLGEVI